MDHACAEVLISWDCLGFPTLFVAAMIWPVIARWFREVKELNVEGASLISPFRETLQVEAGISRQKARVSFAQWAQL